MSAVYYIKWSKLFNPNHYFQNKSALAAAVTIGEYDWILINDGYNGVLLISLSDLESYVQGHKKKHGTKSPCQG